MDGAKRSFSHKQNEDGDFESVCPDCLNTIGVEALEFDLYHSEDFHVCDLDTVRRLWGIRNFSP
jgi:hypothetical protein